MDLHDIPAVSLDGTKHQREHNARLRSIPVAAFSNPIQPVRATETPAPPTETVPSRVVYQESVTALRNELQLAGIQTKEQLDGFLRAIRSLRYSL